MTTLTDRYVWAAIRSVPDAQRAELDRELRERIGDETDARTEHAGSVADAERAALTDLGDPVVLAAEYVDRPLQLIGPRYYLTWLRLLKLLLAVVLPFAALGIAISQAVTGATIGGIIGAVIGIGISIAVHIVFWTTLVFAVLERTPAAPGQRGIDVPWTLDMLPSMPDPGKASRRADLIAALVFLAAFAVALVWQQFWVMIAGVSVPVLNPELWSFWLPCFLVLIVLQAALAVRVYLRGWSWPLTVINLVLSTAFTAAALYLFLTGELFDPAFLDLIGWPWGDDADRIIVTIAVIAVLAGAVWGVVDGVIRTVRDQRSRSSAAGPRR